MPRFKTSDVVDSETARCSFEDLSLSAPLLRSLREMGCEHPSPVQLRTIPAGLAGGDLVVQAKSGTGKTIAFCTIVLEGTDTSSSGPSQGVLLTPTREIALQVADEIRRLGWHLRPALDVACFIGGVPIEEDLDRLESQGPPHIVVGTPGRVLKLLKQSSLATDARFLVLDEADKLLDHNFRQDITLITENVFTETLQFIAVSATFPPPLVVAAEELFVHVEKKRSAKGQPVLRDLPKHIFLCTSAVKKDKDGMNLADIENDDSDKALESAVLKGVLHLKYVLQGYHVRQKMPALLEVLTRAAYQQAFVFVGDSNSAVQIAEMLNQAGVSAAASSGRMEQAWRTQAFQGLKCFQYRVLVCTDLMARGIDVEKVDIVINLDLPAEKETYLHRSGRTARFGSVGWNVSLVFEGEEEEHLQFFQLQLGFELSDYANREAAIAARFQDLELAVDEVPNLQLSAEQVASFPTAPFPAAPEPRSRAPATENNPGGHGHKRRRDRKTRQAANNSRAAPAAWSSASGLGGEGAYFVDEDAEEVRGCSGQELPRLRSALMPAASMARQEAFMPSVGLPTDGTSKSSMPPRRMTAEEAAAAWLKGQPEMREPSPAAQPPLPRATRDSMLGRQQQQHNAAAAGVPVQNILLPPPPVLLPPQSQPPREIQALLPDWQAWMLDCPTYARYAEGHCQRAFGDSLGQSFGQPGLPQPGFPVPSLRGLSKHTQERLEELWVQHCQVWAAE